MANGIRIGDPHGFNKGRTSKFREGSPVQQTPEEGRRTYQPKRCENNKDEDNSLKTLNNKNIINRFWKCKELKSKNNIGDDLPIHEETTWMCEKLDKSQAYSQGKERKNEQECINTLEETIYYKLKRKENSTKQWIKTNKWLKKKNKINF